MFYGQGGYDYATVYNMPLWLRKFTFKKLKDHYETVNGENDGTNYLVNEGVELKNTNKVDIPETVQRAAANYTVKAPKPKK